MKKKFLHLVGCVVICLSSLVHAMGEKEFQVGSTVFSCRATNQQLLERLTLNQSGLDQSRLIIPLSENANEAAFEVSSDGELYMGSIEQIKQLCIKDRDGKEKITKQRGKIGNESLDEANIKEKINQLQEGESLTALFADNNQVTITFDRLMKLISADDMVFPVRQSRIVNSRLIAGIMTHDKKMAAGEIKLDSSGEEIKMLLDFVGADEEGREKLINNLSTFKHIELVAGLHYHFISKTLFSDYWDQLIRKIYNSLKEGELEWFAEISSLPKDQKERMQGIMREVLNEVIKPASPKIVFKKEGVASCVVSATKNLIGCINNQGTMEIIDLTAGKSIIVRSNVKEVRFSPDSTKIWVVYSSDDKKGEIIDLMTGRSIVNRSNVSRMEFRSGSTKAWIRYYGDDYRREIIDLTTGESIVVQTNVRNIEFSLDGTKVRVFYRDGKGEIIDLTTGESIVVRRSNVNWMEFSSDSTKAWISYYGDDKKGEIIDLTTGRSIVVRSNVFHMGFSPDSTKVTVACYGGDKKGEIIDLTTGRSIFAWSNIQEVALEKPMIFSPDSTKVRVSYCGWKGEIIDLTTGRSIVARSDVNWMEFSSDGTKVKVSYRVGKGELIDLTMGESIVVRTNVRNIEPSPDGTKGRAKYYGDDTKGEIIDLTTGESIVVLNNVRRLQGIVFSPDSTKVIILYLNDKMEIFDLVDYDCGINFALFTSEQLLFVFNLRKNPDYLFKIGKNKAIKIWQSFKPEVREILKRDYFPGADFSFGYNFFLFSVLKKLALPFQSR